MENNLDKEIIKEFIENNDFDFENNEIIAINIDHINDLKYLREDFDRFKFKELIIYIDDIFCKNFPLRKFKGDKGLDLRAHFHDSRIYYENHPYIINPMQRMTINTNIQIINPNNDLVMIVPRSGLAKTHGITILNSPAIIDAGFTGMVEITLINLGDKPYEIKEGDRIAQLIAINNNQTIEPKVIQAYPVGEYGEQSWHINLIIPKISNVERHNQGFGSTGR